MPQIYLGQEFVSFEEFDIVFNDFSKETGQIFSKRNSKTIEAANKTVAASQPKFNVELKYSSITYLCIHGAEYETRSKGLRHTKSLRSKCPAKICISANRFHGGKDGSVQRLTIKELSLEHNHVVDVQLAPFYTRNRMDLTAAEMDAVKTAVEMKVSNPHLKSHLNSQGRNLKNRDIQNLKHRVLHSQRDGRNAVQVLVDELLLMQESDAGATTVFAKNIDGNELQYIFYQSSDMKRLFQKYPEHVLLDSTYLLNDSLMPLLSLMVVDGNNRSRVVALILLGSETAEMLEEVLSIFKQNNANNILSFMVDKDFAELAALKKIWPESKVELCLFHVLKSARLKISGLEICKERKDEIKEIFQAIAYASNEEVFQKKVVALENLNCNEFTKYFYENWFTRKEQWVLYWRGQTVNFNDSTNNRLESYHQKLKGTQQNGVGNPQQKRKCVRFLDEDLKEFRDSVKSPKRISRKGRPKGSDMTVIGLAKNKNKKKVTATAPQGFEPVKLNNTGSTTNVIGEDIMPVLVSKSKRKSKFLPEPVCVTNTGTKSSEGSSDIDICNICLEEEALREFCVNGVMQWCDCDKCGKWFHVACIPLGTNAESYVCVQCVHCSDSN